MHKSPELEKILMEKVDGYGNTVAHLAAESGNVEVFKVSKKGLVIIEWCSVKHKYVYV